MKNMIRCQLELVLSTKGFIFSMLLSMIYCILVFVVNAFTYFGSDYNEVLCASYLSVCADFNIYSFKIFVTIFPILSVLPFADSYLTERQKNTIPIILTRTKKEYYYYSKLVAVFISGFVVIFLPLLLNYFLNLLAFPNSSNIDFSRMGEIDSHLYITYIDEMMFSELFLIDNNLYIIFYIFISSLFSGLIAVSVYQFSFFFQRNSAIIICSAFIIQGIINILDIAMISFDVTKYIFAGQLYCNQNKTMFFILLIIYFSFAFIPCFIVKRKLKDLI